MTSTADMTQHPDVSEISDLAEGLLPPSRSADVERHLDACALCADVRTSLEEIRGLLGTLPGNTRMPVDIAERIDAALAAEALLDSTAPDDTAHVSRETTPIVQQREPSGSSARPAGQARGATGPGRKRRSRRAVAVLGAAFTVAALWVSALFLQTLNSDNADKSAMRDQGAQAASAPSDYADPGLDERVRSLLTADSARYGEKAEGARTFGTENEAPTSRMKSAPTAPPCVQRGTGRTDTPIAVEYGSYNGANAYLVVFPNPADDLRVQVYVVDAECADSAPSSTGKLLLKDDYSRR
ncbi:anti-sigma factor family protein [Streptomyces sp. NPDC014894]|uniref:anti-sigma factor family protein n=1 Tax=Streptomyces sp. NPDC014894 TaxID=3364931 RepID=UPI00370186D7